MGRQCTMSSHSSSPNSSLVSEDIEHMDWPARFRSQSHRACMGIFRQTLGSSYLTTSNDSSFDWRYKNAAMLNNSLTPLFSAWADAVKPALAVREIIFPY
ncbi:hypothetical protein TNCV_1083821 [Trichonephila clavipes]|nr:hypothetical protein TNCV_1083821 [Trichonephila clavipes]